jgi:hypothetical protein
MGWLCRQYSETNPRYSHPTKNPGARAGAVTHLHGVASVQLLTPLRIMKLS